MSGTEYIFPDAKSINVSVQEQERGKGFEQRARGTWNWSSISEVCVRYRLLFACLRLSRILPKAWNLKQGACVSYELLGLNANRHFCRLPPAVLQFR